MSALAGRHLPTRQRGAALLVFLMLIVTAALTFAVNNLTPEAVEARRMQKTRQALATAKQALYWYLQTFRDQQYQIDPSTHYVYGYLPLPDLGSTANTNVGCTQEGCDANLSGSALNKTIIGRFPWQLFGTGPIRDGDEECLWYIVSGSHQRVDKATPMNWDTPGQIDIVIVTGGSATSLHSALATAHERPTAIIVAPGPALPGQNRSATDGNNVHFCNGNYNPANYLDPNLLIETASSAYFSGAVTNDTSTTQLALQTQGKLYRESGAYRRTCSASNTTCTLDSNDTGATAAPDEIFEQVRRNAHFRQDINSMLDRIAGCLRDAYYGAGSLPAYAKISAYPDTCYADNVDPQNYYAHYGEMTFVAPGNGVAVNGVACNGALLFAGQRGLKQDGNKQMRSSDTEKNTALYPAAHDNYFEGINLTSIRDGGTEFSGPESFGRTATQSAAQDIVRCIPNTPSFATATSSSPALSAAGVSLASYAPNPQSLTLGQAITSALSTQISAHASSLYACAWKPETHAMGGGLRSYFMFRINDAGFSTAPAEGITFAIVDGDNNDATACGAASQHLGYSGDNGESAFIVPPKIGFEIDTRREGAFNPAAANPLLNGRNDPYSSPTSFTPRYIGGHVAVVYWGGDSPIGTLAPAQDDNVHGHPVAPYTPGRSNYPLPPANPGIPWPIAPQQGAYKLDPNLSAVPTTLNQAYPDFHVRIELTRLPVEVTLPKARVATTATLNLSSPGAAIDTIFLASGDRILVKDQADAKDNGVYVWNGGGNAMTRAGDFNSTITLNGAVIEIDQGATNARSLWHQATAHPTVGISSILWHNLRVKVATSTMPTLPASRIDGILMKAGDRVLVKDSGIHIWQDASTLTSVVSNAGAAVQVQQGSDASGWWHYDGSDWLRQSARVATQTNLNMAAPGAVIDGVTMANGDLILVKSQANASENGLYAWAGEASALTSVTWPATALIQVLEGADSGRAFRQTSATAWSSIDGSPSYLLEAWILQDSPTESLRIAALKNTTRPMGLLSPAFAAHLRTTPKIPYPFRNVRLGYTIGQRTSVMDQNFTISNAFTTWID